MAAAAPGADVSSGERGFRGRSQRRGPNARSSQHRPAQPDGRTDAGAGKRPKALLPAGLAVRNAAVRIVSTVADDSRTLDDALASALGDASGLELRDRAAARRIAMAAVRRFHSLDATLATYLDRGYPKRSGAFRNILIVAAAQLLMLETPAHAVIDLAVSQIRQDRRAAPFAGLANAVLRRLSETGAERFAVLDAAALDVPKWLYESWREAYGDEAAQNIAIASLQEPALDITVKSDPETWAEALDGTVLPTGNVRRRNEGRVEDLPGFAEGKWWVQDAASAIPARLLGDVRGKVVADLCAAPGGKTAQLLAAGANVFAVDLSAKRLERLRANMGRLGLQPTVVADDARTWRPDQPLDAVLLDVPCSATGTIRRHPDILHHRQRADMSRLLDLQHELLISAVEMVRPGGLIVYGACSLQPEEGPEQIERLLAERSDTGRLAVTPEGDGIPGEFVTASGDVRTLPHYLQLGIPQLSGIDGFFASRLQKLI